MLSQELKDLEKNKIISRKQSKTIPVRVEYTITEFGETFIPIVEMFEELGTQHLAGQTPGLKKKKKTLPIPVQENPVLVVNHEPVETMPPVLVESIVAAVPAVVVEPVAESSETSPEKTKKASKKKIAKDEQEESQLSIF